VLEELHGYAGERVGLLRGSILEGLRGTLYPTEAGDDLVAVAKKWRGTEGGEARGGEGVAWGRAEGAKVSG
jgi:hypothetical protein